MTIGRHTFYSPDDDPSGNAQASLALMFMQLASFGC